MLTQKDKIYVKLIKKTTLHSLKNQDWKKVKIETEKLKRLFPNVPMDNITELNKLIYHISPTLPLGQDMTQGQFLSGVLTGLN